MGTFVTTTSDKKKDIALKWWKCGCFGILGFENFYTLKFLRGTLHFIAGIFTLIWFLLAVTSVFVLDSISQMATFFGVFAFSYLVTAVPNFVRLKLGKFCDSNGALLLE